MLSVGEDLPQVQPPEEPQDPEAQAEPVSVVMPESTKTAEDKLMADIAEAMTGNPLTLDSPEAPEPYRIPENFFASMDTGTGTETQSAENKLIASIAQAMSESPLGVAQDQARQSLEEDINPFDEMPLPDAINRFDPDPEPAEEPEEPDETEESFLPDFHEDTEEQNTAELEETEEPETEEYPNDPFTIPDFGDDDDEPQDEQQEESLLNEAEELPIADDSITEQHEEPEQEEPEVQEAEPEPEPKPDNTALTAQERLAQELEAFQQREAEEHNQPEPEINAGTAEVPDNDIKLDDDISFEEVSPEDNMPEEKSLLDEDENEPETAFDDDSIASEDDDDWDMSSLGALSEAASVPDDEPEEISRISARSTDTEEDYKEKTMSIRDKLSAKKNGASDGTKKSGSGGIMLYILLGLLLAATVMTFLQLRTLNDRITAAMMNMGTFDSPALSETPPSYDYAIDFILDPNINERMALRGRDGWQVVGSRRTQDSTTGQYGYEFIFMRRSR